MASLNRSDTDLTPVIHRRSFLPTSGSHQPNYLAHNNSSTFDHNNNSNSNNYNEEDNDGNDNGNDDEDDFLTLDSRSSRNRSTTGGALLDREALVRKKILENFYGKSAVVAAMDHSRKGGGGVESGNHSNNHDDDDDDFDDFDDETTLESTSRRSRSRGDDSADGRGGDHATTIDDLDSPYFDAESHVRQHIVHSSLHTLLEHAEQLSLHIRTLDSTMQTLVYENYSRFIDATDAIRSVNVHVEANQEGLDRLVRDMAHVDEQSRTVEQSLGSLRDQVADKIRVKRLLTRLDTLLNLPVTLKQHISNGRYIMAVRSYLSAVSILRQYSDGFESLRTIETECIAIIEQLKVDLQRKMKHWSGRAVLLETSWYDDDNHADDHENGEGSGLVVDDGDKVVSTSSFPAASSMVVPPPKILGEIFECVGSLRMLFNNSIKRLSGSGNVESEAFSSREQQQPPLNRNDDDDGLIDDVLEEDLRSLSLASSVRWLDRVLDAHMIRVQDHRSEKEASLSSSPSLSMDATGLAMMESVFQMGKGGATTTSTARFSSSSFASSSLNIPTLQPEPTISSSGGALLIPVDFLAGILETVHLFQSTFSPAAKGVPNDGGHNDITSISSSLVEFVAEAFGSFVVHVRAVLLEEAGFSSITDQNNDTIGISSAVDDTETSPSSNHHHPHEAESQALALLVSSVQDLSAGLRSTNAIRGDTPDRIVDQVMHLSKTFVYRRVEQTFCQLRLSVVRNCLMPFAERAVAALEEKLWLSNGDDIDDKDNNNNEPPEPLRSIVQLGGSALADCLQLVDDTIRTIFSTTTGSTSPLPPSTTTTTTTTPTSSTVGDDHTHVLTQAVQSSAQRFAVWLASAFEVLAGGESGDPMMIMEAPPTSVIGSEVDDERPNSTTIHGGKIVSTQNTAFVLDDLGDDDIGSTRNAVVLDLMNQARRTLLRQKGHEDDDDEWNNDGEVVHWSFILGIADICRLAQGMVSDSLEQSIATHVGFGKKKQRGSLFPSTDETILRSGNSSGGIVERGHLGDVSHCFRIAQTRLLVLFAVQRGDSMASILCQNLATLLASTDDDTSISKGPSEEVYNALHVVKQTCIECAGLFGGSSRAGPVPTMEDDLSSMSILFTSSNQHSRRKTGLLLDVERMFKEQVTIYPHPQEEHFEASRNSIVFLVFKVAFRGLMEYVRMNSVTSVGFRQLQMNVELCKLMIPHYVNKDFTVHGNAAHISLSNLLTDVMISAAERCCDPDLAEDEAIKVESRKAVRIGMDSIEERGVAEKFIMND